MKISFEKSLKLVLASEGGYSCDPADPGGETNFGISKRAHPDEDIKGMTLERAGEIYRKNYWDAVRGDDLPAGVDYAVFDAAVNHGPRTAGILLQRAANRQGEKLQVDGMVGWLTLLAVGRCDPGWLLVDILRERDIFYRKIIARDPTQERFGRGWMNRLAAVRENLEGFA